jgi:HlyD family secretion protein
MKRIGLWIGILGILLVTAACGQMGGETTTETTPPPVVTRADADVVLAEGRVEAAESRTLSFESAGTVLSQEKEEGDSVEAGDLLLRLDPTDAKLAVQQAEAAVAQAEARLARLKAEPRPEDVAVLEAQVNASQAAITQTLAQRSQLLTGAHEAGIAAAEAEVAAAQAQELVTRLAHDDTMKCRTIEKPDGSEEQICPTLGRLEEEARFAWHAAREQLAAAQAYLDTLSSQHDAQLYTAYTNITAARSQSEVAQAQLEQIQAPIQKEEIQTVEAAIQEAQVALEKTKVALDRTELRAPFAGTVTRIMVEEGAAVTYGMPVLNLATLDTLQIRTIDLDELNVARLEIGQPATVVLDAFPDAELTGHITEIGLEAVDYRGDVTYPVVVMLDEQIPQMRLGMTALVTFDIGE